MYLREPTEMIVQLLVPGPMVAQYGQNATEPAIRFLGLPLAAGAIILPAIVLTRGLKPLPSVARLLATVLGLAGVMFLAGTLVFADLDPIRGLHRRPVEQPRPILARHRRAGPH